MADPPGCPWRRPARVKLRSRVPTLPSRVNGILPTSRATRGPSIRSCARIR